VCELILFGHQYLSNFCHNCIYLFIVTLNENVHDLMEGLRSKGPPKSNASMRRSFSGQRLNTVSPKVQKTSSLPKTSSSTPKQKTMSATASAPGMATEMANLKASVDGLCLKKTAPKLPLIT
jgi:hypothetical protein